MPRRCLIIIAISTAMVLGLAFMVFPGSGGARKDPAGLSWEEMAAHAGLVGIKPKTEAEFKVDVMFEMGRNIDVVKAAIDLSGEEWAHLNSSTANHLLHPWTTGCVDIETWKRTVDLILPFENTAVNVERLNVKDKAVILRRPDMRSVRVYMLSPNADGKGGVLFYFFHSYL